MKKRINVLLLLSMMLVDASAFAARLSRREIQCIKVATTAHSEMYQCDKLKLIYLDGTPEERAQAYGELMAQGKVTKDLLEQFSQRLEQNLNRGKLWPSLKKLQLIRALRLWFGNQVLNQLYAKLPIDLQHEYEIFAHSAGLDVEAYRRVTGVPDLAAIQTGQKNINTTSLSKSEIEEELGCTVVGLRLQDRMLIGRNFDYSTRGIWEKNPSLIVQRPLPSSNSSEELATATWTTDGIQYPSISGVNEKGVGLFLQQAFTSSSIVLDRGYPVYAIGTLVLRKAHDIEQAIQLIQKYRPRVHWIFSLFDLKTHDQVVVEAGPKDFFVRRLGGGLDGRFHIVQANALHSPKAYKLETQSFGRRFHSQMREAQFEKFVQENKINNINDIALFLNFHQDPSGGLAVDHDVATVGTVQTVLVESAKAKQDVSQARYSLSVGETPAAGGAFIEMTHQQLFSRGDNNLQVTLWNPSSESDKHVRARQVDLAAAFNKNWDSHLQILENVENALGQEDNSPASLLIRSISRYRHHDYQKASDLAWKGWKESGHPQLTRIEMEQGQKSRERNSHGEPSYVEPSHHVAESLLALALLSEEELHIGYPEKKRQFYLQHFQHVHILNGAKSESLRNLSRQYINNGFSGEEFHYPKYEFFYGDVEF